MTIQYRASVVGIALALVTAGAGCTTSNPGTANQTPSPASIQPTNSQTTATISNFSFQPQTLTVKAGTTVTWTNEDSMDHTITADDASFDSGSIPTNQTYSHTFTAAGTYAYHCAVHPSMHGTVVVQQ